MMPSTEAHKRAVAKYYEKTYTRVGINFRKSELAVYREAAKKEGLSFDAFVKKAISEHIEKAAR